jgi:competence ComEA-like helix-hairpin-helix protein
MRKSSAFYFILFSVFFILLLNVQNHSIFSNFYKILLSSVGYSFQVFKKGEPSSPFVLDNQMNDEDLVQKEDDNEKSEMVSDDYKNESLKENETKNNEKEIEESKEDIEDEEDEEDEQDLEEDLNEDEDDDNHNLTKNYCPVDINTSSFEELQSIVGVGPVIAQRIIENRPFSSLNDLLKVKGVGEKTLQKIINQNCAYVSKSSYSLGSVSSTFFPENFKILISEVKIEGEEDNDDFIELYNPNNFNVDISGYKLRKRTSSGSEYSIIVFSKGTIISARSHFLWANKSSSYAVYADVSSSQTLAKNNSIALFDSVGNIVSSLGWGSGVNQFYEGAIFPENPKNTGSLGRIMLNSKEYKDSSNNSLDFKIQKPTPKDYNSKNINEPDIKLIPVNLISNEFFNEWSESLPSFWKYSGSLNNVLKSENALRGNHALLLKPITTANNLIQEDIDISNSGTYYIQVWLKPLNVNDSNYIRVSVDFSLDQNSFPRANFIDFKKDSGWIKFDKEIKIENNENLKKGALRIRVQRVGQAGPAVLIGAVWFSQMPPPFYWPLGYPPERINNFNLSGIFNQVSLSWDPVLDLDSLPEEITYYIYYSKNKINSIEDISEAKFATTTKNNITLFPLDYNSTYYFGIRASDRQNNFSEISTTTSYETPKFTIIDNQNNINFVDLNKGVKMAKDSQGKVYVVYEKQGKLFLSYSDDFENWTNKELFLTDKLEQKNPYLAIDSDDIVHIVFQQKKASDQFFDIYHFEYKDGSLTKIENLTNDIEGECEFPAIVPKRGGIFLASFFCQSNDSAKIYLKEFSDGLWRTKNILNLESIQAFKNIANDFSFILDDNGFLHLIFLSDNFLNKKGLFYKKIDLNNSNLIWQDFEFINDNSDALNISLSFYQNDIFVCWSLLVENNSKQKSLRCSQKINDVWNIKLVFYREDFNNFYSFVDFDSNFYLLFFKEGLGLDKVKDF